MRTVMGYSFCFLLSFHVLYNILFIMFMALKTTFWASKKAFIVKRELTKAEKVRNSVAFKKRNA